MEDIWQCLTKGMKNECCEDSDTTSSEDSTISSDSIGSPPLKRPRRLRRLLEFKTAEQLEDLKSVAAEVVELKDYAEWFMSRPEANVDDIFSPKTYCEWFSSLGTEAKANVILHPYNYCTWFMYFVQQGIEPPRVDKMETREHMNRRYGELALACFSEIGGGIEYDYEYTSGSYILEFENFVHLNFYARLKVSESRPEPGPEQLFFAEVNTQNKVTKCCILDSEEYDNSNVRHPPGFECLPCMDYNDVCYSSCACDDEE